MKEKGGGFYINNWFLTCRDIFPLDPHVHDMHIKVHSCDNRVIQSPCHSRA
jgi:hypothetical protein